MRCEGVLTGPLIEAILCKNSESSGESLFKVLSLSLFGLKFYVHTRLRDPHFILEWNIDRRSSECAVGTSHGWWCD